MPALSRRETEVVVNAAALAPSVLNVQPWRFVADGDAIELHKDLERSLPHSDPDGRSLTVSCGAALLNLRLAIVAAGRRPEVSLLPDEAHPSLLARVVVGAAQAPSRAESRLHAAIVSRRTSRVPYVDEPIAPEVVLELENVADVEGATLRVLDAYELADIGKLVRDADFAERFNADLRAEVLAWTQRGPDAVDGIPAGSFGPAPNDLSSLVRDFAMGLPVEGRAQAEFERDPTLAVLLTDGDERRDWLLAGQALERVWLEATAAGLAVSLLMQPLELAETRWLARPPRAGAVRTPSEPGSAPRRPYWPQALLRIGVGMQQTPPTPRRPLSDILTVA